MALLNRHPGLHTIEIQGVSCTTDVPPEVELFDTSVALNAKKDGRMGYSLRMAATDQIAPGEYMIRARMKPYVGRINRRHTQQIAVRESEAGRVIDMNSFGVDPLRYATARQQLAAVPLMHELGFETDGEVATGWPTPATFVTAAARLGIEARTFPYHGQVPDEEYTTTFAEGAYPAGLWSDGYYTHDTNPLDHAAAKVLGGYVLTGALTQMAGDGLEIARTAGDLPLDVARLGITSGILDSYTGILRTAVVDDGTDWQDEVSQYQRYGSIDTPLQALYSVGKRGGLPSYRTDEVLEVARDSARTLGVPVIAA